METVFDHDITEKEQNDILGFITNKREFLTFGLDQRRHYEKLFYLYSVRNNKAMAKKFLDLIPNDTTKFFTTLNFG